MFSLRFGILKNGWKERRNSSGWSVTCISTSFSWLCALSYFPSFLRSKTQATRSQYIRTSIVPNQCTPASLISTCLAWRPALFQHFKQWWPFLSTCIPHTHTVCWEWVIKSLENHLDVIIALALVVIDNSNSMINYNLV